jgi:hypothetical protein
MNFSLSHIYILIVILSFLCSLVSFGLHYPFHLKIFSIFLGITALTEISANFLLGFFRLDTNYPIYNCFMLVEYTMTAFYFKQVITSGNFKKLITAFMLFFPVFWLATVIWKFGMNGWNSYSLMLGDLFVIIICARHLYEMITSDELISFRNSSEFWITAALIFYSCCELPITGILNYLVQDWKLFLQLENVLQILNIIMYATFIYAFLCRIKTTVKS